MLTAFETKNPVFKQVNMANEDLRVLWRDPVTHRIKWGIGDSPKTVTGVEKLVQIFVLTLLESQEVDIFDPEAVTGLPNMIGTYNVDAMDSSEMIATLTDAVSRTEQQVIAYQKTQHYVHKTELLVSATILEIARSENVDEVNMSILLTTAAGDKLNFIL